MKDPFLSHLKQFSVFGAIFRLLVVSLGLIAGVYGQDAETARLWREWMSVLQREPSQISGPRVYLMTDREVLQTSPEKASFQNGSYRIVLADGSVPDVDGDVDLYTDGFEDQNNAFRNNAESIPLDGNGNPLPIDAFPILIANGSVLGIADSTLSSNTAAQLVRESGGSAVRLVGAPASNLVRPFAFRDFSSRFYYYYQIQGQPEGTYKNYPLSLYYTEKEFPTPQDCSALETSMVPGGYVVEFPTIANAPYGKATAQVAHRLVPNGALTLGLKKPTWLVRSLKSYEKDNTAPLAQSWVNGKLKFDPYLPFDITWDNIAVSGLASASDFIEMSLEDENLGQVSFTFRVQATTSSLSLNLKDSTINSYGTVRQNLEAKTFPLSANGHILLKYKRYANGQASADLSSVTVRVPIEMYISYASWRKELFSLLEASNDSISGPNADPDKDGVTNQQEYNQGTDPLVANIAVVNATSADLTTVSATLGATIVQDPLALDNPLVPNSIQIYDRGVVYSPSSINPAPVIDGPGVLRAVSSAAEAGIFTVPVTDLSSDTQYSFRGYVITSAGTYYNTPVASFTTLTQPPVTLPSVSSPTSAGVTSTSVSLGGDVTSDGGSPIIERGVVFSPTSTNDNPFIGGNVVTKVVGTGTTGVFTVNVTGLLANTTYSFRAYAINSVGTSHTLTIGSFTTPAAPTITSPTSANITSSSATLGGDVASTGGAAVIQRGVVFSLTSANDNPSIGGIGVRRFIATSSGAGVFTVNVTGLSPGTSYSFKAYAINSVGTSYTTVATFNTAATLATVTTPTISNITSTSATLGANVTSDGSSAILERGFVYSVTATDSNPNVGDPAVIMETVTGTTGAFSKNLTGLVANTGYTFKAFARNSVGIAYGAPYSFFTTLPPLVVTTPTVANVTATTATLGGAVQSDGGTTVNERGVVISLNPAPAVGGSGVVKIVGSGTMGVFTVPVTGLLSNTLYYFRAYATNGSGTSYSDSLSFNTQPVQLLGQSLVQWAQAPQQAIRSYSTLAPASLLAPLQAVPQFVYYKDSSEINDPLVYQIEVSTDFSVWQSIDSNEWRLEETIDAITATWASSGSPPARIFFRVYASSN